MALLAALQQLYERLEASYPSVFRAPRPVSTAVAATFWGLHLPIVQAWLAIEAMPGLLDALAYVNREPIEGYLYVVLSSQVSPRCSVDIREVVSAWDAYRATLVPAEPVAVRVKAPPRVLPATPTTETTCKPTPAPPPQPPLPVNKTGSARTEGWDCHRTRSRAIGALAATHAIGALYDGTR